VGECGTSGCVKGGVFIDKLSDYQILNKDSVPCSELVNRTRLWNFSYSLKILHQPPSVS
jgi:hypothetical protein